MYDVRQLRLTDKTEIRNDGNATLRVMIDGDENGQFVLFEGDECRYEPDVRVPENGLEVTSIALGVVGADTDIRSTPHSYMHALRDVPLACTIRVWNHRGTCRMEAGVVLGVLRIQRAAIAQVAKVAKRA